MEFEMPHPKHEAPREPSYIDPTALAIENQKKALNAFIATKLAKGMKREDIEGLCLSERLVVDPDANELEESGKVVRQILTPSAWKTLTSAQIDDYFDETAQTT
ncbi:MAG: hypothetical protein RLZZ416_721 [Candidatus Parcubacteria bacterium]|jgi:hypothetical protein